MTASAPVKDKIIYLIGAGPGHPDLLTQEARRALADAAFVIGAPRLLDGAASLTAGKKTFPLVKADEILRCIAEEEEAAAETNAESGSAAVLLSGDPGFYSGAKNLIAAFREKGMSYRVISGVSSLTYFLGRLGQPWEDVYTVSLHGRTADVAGIVRAHTLGGGAVFFLTDHVTDAGDICRILTDAGLGGCRVSVGEKLSYAEERITAGPAAKLADRAARTGRAFESPHVVLVGGGGSLV
jgi:precorrin-6y C5,15-methyltransferase (decarboxylating) CbiE subunit